MTQTGWRTPTNKIVFGGTPLVQELKIETATNCYPGRLVCKGTNDDDVVVADGLKPVCGILGYEQANPAFMPTNMTTLYTANDQAPVLSGSGFLAKLPGGLLAGTVAAKNDPILSWANGQVVPAGEFGGKYALKIPFTQSSDAALDTGIELPAGVLVTGALIQVTTAVNGGTIDVGIDASESGGDADGFLDGVSCAATGLVWPVVANTTDGSNTLGALISDTITSADNSAVSYRAPVALKCDGTAKTITYQTSEHAVAGNIFLFVESPGVQKIGKAGASASAASAAADIQVEVTGL